MGHKGLKFGDDAVVLGANRSGDDALHLLRSMQSPELGQARERSPAL